MNEVCELLQSGQQATFYQSKEQGFIGGCLLNETPARIPKSEMSRRISKLHIMKTIGTLMLLLVMLIGCQKEVTESTKKSVKQITGK